MDEWGRGRKWEVGMDKIKKGSKEKMESNKLFASLIHKIC